MWKQDGDTWVLVEKTQKPFAQFRVDATRGLMTGLSGLFTTHTWGLDQSCTIQALGADGSLRYEETTGTVTCKVRFKGFPATLLKEKILSDVAAITTDVCGAPSLGNKDVFIVHGHNVAARAELKDFLRDLQLRPVVLVDQDDLGLSIVEKFEYYARGCAFAFVLMTPDDEVRGDDTAGDDARRRARQNVILELGWFMAHLGRTRVAILYNGKLEIPSDINGVAYMEFDKSVRGESEKIRQRLSGIGLIA